MRPWRKGGTLDLSAWSLRERVSHLSEIAVGEVLVNDSLQFDAHNLFRVTRIEPQRALFYGRFCDPNDPSRPRVSDDQELAVHAFELASTSRSRYYHAVPAGSAPSLPPDEDAPPLPDIGPLLSRITSKPYFGDWLQ